MSRRHPGTSADYGLKKRLYNVKVVERRRRNYFRNKRRKLGNQSSNVVSDDSD